MNGSEGEGGASVFDLPKIDCHAHVTDPDRFPYGAGIAYHPRGQEIGTADQLVHLMDAFNIRHTLLVQPNSGYGPDNACLLDAIARHPGRFSGMAIVAPDAGAAELQALREQGVIGVAFNPTLYGNDHYRDCRPLIARLADLGMMLNLQVVGDQFRQYLPWIREIPVTVLIDHTGCPRPSLGRDQPGFAELLTSADTGRVWVKLSGYAKFSAGRFPFADCHPSIEALVGAFSIDRCLWASDWPYLRAPDRQDVGLLLKLLERLFPAPADRARVLWHSPAALLGLTSSGEGHPI
ncbi:MAG: amidohydrolase family protein [Rhodobacteraceae bacterium]|nr:amidohydrolase family protein [Paracoccaceae bacterium]